MQTLPAGFLSAPTGAGGTAFPLGVSADQKWQWHYSASEFVAQGPITICGLSVRAASGGGGVTAFDFPSLTVTMATAITTYGTGTHHAVFSSNLGSDATVVHSGRWAGGPVASPGAATAPWVDIPLAQPFAYDPSAGDFVIQLEKCGTTAHWGALLEGRAGTTGTNGGNRYGDLSNCAATTSNFSNDEYVPLVRLTYQQGVGAPCAAPPPDQYQVNQPRSGLTLGGLPDPGPFAPIQSVQLVGQVQTLELSSDGVGLPFDVALRIPGATQPYSFLGLQTAGGQVVNLNLLAAYTTYLNGGVSSNLATSSFPPGPVSVSFSSTLPIIAAAQMAVADPGNVDGLALSHACEYIAQACALTEDFEWLQPAAGLASSGGPYPVGWADGGGGAEWQVGVGTTTSPGTGPACCAPSGVQYMYCETSLPNNPGVVFAMDTCAYDVSVLSQSSLSFRLSRLGVDIGTLRVLMDDGSGTFPTLLGQFIGPDPTGTDWTLESLSFVPAGVSARFRFEYTSGLGFAGDLAIDRVTVQ